MTDYILELAYDSADTTIEDVLQSRLFLAGSNGNSSREEGGTTTVSAYFDSETARDDAADLFRDVAVELSFADRARVDWLDMYQQSLHAITIGSRFVVAPDPSLVPEGSDRLSIVLPQEQAFGTGSHETTALCMEMLETRDITGARGLDIGSGSGILAIAMLRLGAARVIAFDNDRDAYAALRDNRMRNAVAEESMPLFIGGVDALRLGVFDVITMNIIPEVIVPLLGDVKKRLNDSGTLILSGILTTRRDHVIAAAAQRSLTLIEQRDRGEWWCGAFHRDTKSLAKPSQMY
jgi:ribosomal protein L11 methyltransferase